MLSRSLNYTQEKRDNEALNNNNDKINKVFSILMKCSEENKIGQWDRTLLGRETELL